MQLQLKKDNISEDIKLDKQVKNNNNIRNPYPFCIEENIIFIFHPLTNRMYSIPNN